MGAEKVSKIQGAEPSADSCVETQEASKYELIIERYAPWLDHRISRRQLLKMKIRSQAALVEWQDLKAVFISWIAVAGLAALAPGEALSVSPPLPGNSFLLPVGLASSLFGADQTRLDPYSIFPGVAALVTCALFLVLNRAHRRQTFAPHSAVGRWITLPLIAVALLAALGITTSTLLNRHAAIDALASISAEFREAESTLVPVHLTAYKPRHVDEFAVTAVEPRTMDQGSFLAAVTVSGVPCDRVRVAGTAHERGKVGDSHPMLAAAAICSRNSAQDAVIPVLIRAGDYAPGDTLGRIAIGFGYGWKFHSPLPSGAVIKATRLDAAASATGIPLPMIARHES